MRKQFDDDEDAFDERGILRDGHTFRVRMLDSYQRDVARHFGRPTSPARVTDAAGESGLALCRPGWRLVAGGSPATVLARDAAHRDATAAYAEWERDATTAWKGDDDEGEVTFERAPRNRDSAAAAHAAYADEIENAWRTGK